MENFDPHSSNATGELIAEFHEDYTKIADYFEDKDKAIAYIQWLILKELRALSNLK